MLFSLKTKLFISIAVMMFLFVYQNSYAQYNVVVNGKAPQSMEIVQVDNTKNSTLIFFKCTNLNYSWMNFGENTYIEDAQTGNEYKLLNSINMPISGEGERKFHIFDRERQKHYFCLEFEKIPDSVKNFDLIEDEKNPNAFNFYDIQIDKQKVNSLIDVDDFVKSTPVKEYGFQMKDGSLLQYYKHKGLVLFLTLYIDKQYGKYYQAWIDVQNLTGKSILISPNNITAKTVILKKKNQEIKNLQVLSYENYMKKVNRSQKWSAFAVAFGNAMAASNAGYSYSTTNTKVTGYSKTHGSASGYVGNVYGSASGYSSTYSTAYGRSTTTSYNGAAAYAAQQDAAQNTNAYMQNQYEIKSKLSKGYAKANTIPNQTEFMGYVNIKYTDTNNITISIPINGGVYLFQQRWGKSN